jgi:Skp family chaperone for outer membrane proteins
MVRWGVLAAGAAVVAGAAFVTGKSIPPRPPAEPPKIEARAVGALGARGPKTAYFNMARLMREYKRAAAHLAAVTEKQKRVLARVKGLRDMHVELQAIAQKTADANEKHRVGREMVTVARMIEDYDRAQAKFHQERSGEIIAELFHEIQATVAEMAREKGLSVVLAYPAPVTPQEAENPAIMELTLKPPAAYPFYLDPSVDYTDELLQRLNAKFAAEPGDK